MSYKEITELEISKICVNVTHWDSGEKEVALEWVEDMPPPYTDNEVSINIDRDTAIELIETLKRIYDI